MNDPSSGNDKWLIAQRFGDPVIPEVIITEKQILVISPKKDILW